MNVVLSRVWVGIPVISPVFRSIDKLAGRSGEISKVPPGTIMYGANVPMSVLFNATKVGGGVLPFGDESGPAIQTGGTAFGPSHIPSPSVSGSSGSVPVFCPLM